MARLQEVVFDSRDPPALAKFWAAVLDGYEVRAYDDAEIERLASLGLTPETDPNVAVDGDGPTLFFRRSSEPKLKPNRIHLDVRAPVRSTEVQRLEKLGAKVRDEHENFPVMLDPEGNEFCVVDPR